MTAVRLYLDADSMRHAVLAGLRARGVDVMTALEAELTGGSDDQQLEFARSQGRVLVSFNASDFCRIHCEFLSRGESHAGMIMVPQQRYTIGELIRRLVKLIAATTAETM